MFANDVKENIRFLVTFCDGRKPPVLEAIKEAKLACQTDSKGLPCYQKFNNGAIYVNNQDEEDNMSTMEWNNGMKNFKSFFQELLVMPTKSLQETKEILVFMFCLFCFFFNSKRKKSDKVEVRNNMVSHDFISLSLTLHIELIAEGFKNRVPATKESGTLYYYCVNVAGQQLY